MAIKSILPHATNEHFLSTSLLKSSLLAHSNYTLFFLLEFVEYHRINPLSSTFANMKFTLILALASVFTGVISAPITAPEADLSVEKRQTDVNSIITTLTAAIAPQIASIGTSQLNPLAYKTPR
jgi:hypothetical protein